MPVACGPNGAHRARALNIALHAAAGIVLAVVAVEVMPRALDSLSGWTVGIAFLSGGALYMGLEALVSRLQSRDAGDAETRTWMVSFAVATDLFADGLLIGAGSAISLGLGLLLALAQVLADVPEGYAVIANLRDKGIPHRRPIHFSVSFAVPVPFFSHDRLCLAP